MKTSKPISTISYNSEEFLKAKLDYLVRSGEVAFWYYIKHHGEYDKETNIQDKDHIHLYIQCCDRVGINRYIVGCKSLNDNYKNCCLTRN